MKNELGITKGEWVTYPTNEDRERVDIFSVKGILCRVFYGEVPPVITKEEAEANAQLIAEAGTVTNETGKTPRQLADDNKVLLEALKELLTHALEHDLHGHFTDNAKQAIKQVTE